jgi:hypothetical protein
MAALTLHQGDQQQEFAEHPTELARQALIAAAAVEGEDWAYIIRRFARALPNRVGVIPSSEIGGDA